MNMSKREAIAAKKEAIVDAFLAAGWRPNIGYLDTRPYRNFLSLNDRGQIVDSYFGRPQVGEHHYLISPDKQYAVTIKPQVLTLHDAARNYCKVLSMKHEEVEIFPDRLVSGILEVRIK